MSLGSEIFRIERAGDGPTAPAASGAQSVEVTSTIPADSLNDFGAGDSVFVQDSCLPLQQPGPRLVPALLVCGLVAAIGSVGWMSYRGTQRQDELRASQIQSDNYFGAITPVSKMLATEYRDANGDMLADPPTDPTCLVDPETLVVAHYEGDCDDEPRINWSEFQSHLAASTGKTVVMQEYLHSAAEVESIAAGKIHLVVTHAADIPCLVNHCGLVPVAALGTNDGPNGNHMVVAVRPDSSVRSLDDLKGTTLTCTRALSITGYRAAVTILAQQADMLLDKDYKVYLTDGQARSIRGLAAGWYEAVALSHDKLEWAIEGRTIDESQFRVIYESEVIPRRTVGHIHNLAPALIAKLKAAIFAFENQITLVDESINRPMRFYPTNYWRDYQFVRKMDNSFDPRCGRLLAARSER